MNIIRLRSIATVIASMLLILAFFAPTLDAQTTQIIEIIDASGDGAGNTLEWPTDIAVDSSGNVYVTGTSSDNAFVIPWSLVFTDGFESGDTSDWSTTVP